MKKSFLLLTALLIITSGMYNTCNAADTAGEKAVKRPAPKESKMPEFGCEKPFGPPPEFAGKPLNPEFAKHHHGQFGPGLSKEEMQAKKAEFEKRLNLTEEQKKKIESNHQKDRKKMESIFEKKKELRERLEKIKSDDSLSDAEKNKKIAEIRRQNKELHEKAEKCRKENMKNFEAILTDEQKLEFEKIKAEKKAEFEKRKKEFEKNGKFHGQRHPECKK